MSAGFGFSVGDFLVAIKLVKDVGLALKDTGGAADDYQDVVRELEGLVAVFQEVQSLTASSKNSALLNAVRGQAQLSQQTITLFLKRIQKYNAKLGGNAKRGFHHGTLSKAKWATCVSKEVGKLHDVVQAQSVGVMLLLNMLNIKTTFEIEQQGREQKRSCDIKVAQDEQQRLETHAVIEATRTSVQSSIESKRNNIISQIENHGVHHDHIVHDVLADLKASTFELQSSLANGQTHTTNLIKDLETGSATRAQIDELTRLLKSVNIEHKGSPPKVGNPQHTEVPPSTACPRSELALGIPLHRVSLVPTDILQEIARILTTITKASLILISRLATIVPQLLVFLKILSAIPASPTTLLLDNIRFEDVLGRPYSLQYQQFKHWPTFKSMLECAFENMPGQEKVLSGHYRIMNARFQDDVINKSNWRQKIFPGTQIVMSVDIGGVKIRLGYCPRVQCSGLTRRLNSVTTVCRECGLHFFTSNSSLKKSVPRVSALSSGSQSLDFKAEVERTKAHLKRLGLPHHGLRRGYEADLFRKSTELSSDHERFLEMLSRASELPRSQIKSLRGEVRLKVLGGRQKKPPDLFELSMKAERLEQQREEEELLLFRRIHFHPQDKQATSKTTKTRDLRLGDAGVKHIIICDFASTSTEDHLHHAISDGNLDQVTKIIENGIDINKMDPVSGTFLQNAISLGANEVADLLLQYGADPLIGDPANNAIHSAALHRNGLLLTLLLLNARSRSDLDDGQDLGSYMDIINRALYVASLRGYNDIVLALVNAGADALVKLDNGQSALDAALHCISQGSNVSTEEDKIISVVVLLREAIEAGQLDAAQCANLMVAATNSRNPWLQLQSSTCNDMLAAPGPYSITSPQTRNPVTTPVVKSVKKTYRLEWTCCCCNSPNFTEDDHVCSNCMHFHCQVCGAKDYSEQSDDIKARVKKVWPPQFPCRFCPKRFNRAYNLRSHLRTHNDEGPFVCTVCGEAFALQSDRENHEEVHYGSVSEATDGSNCAEQ